MRILAGTFQALGLLGLTVLILPSPVAGDWLVLHDGTRIETSGPWKVKGRQVVYTGTNGALSALRLADVDLEASEAATNAPTETTTSQQPAPESRRQSVLVLTNDDIKPAAQPTAPEASEAEAATDDSEAALENQGPVELVTWNSRESTDVEGLEIHGTIQNRGEDIAAGIVVQVSVTDENGEPLMDTKAFLQRASLGPGQSGNFKALLPGVYTLFEDPTIRLSSDQFSIQGPDRNEDDEASEETADSIGGEAGGASG
ncbi:MAG: hypothetical protein AAF560_03380 [Acidobacteriota bacterium]